MGRRFDKTEAGHREVQDRKHGLSRSARTLLVVLDKTRTDEELIAMIRGSSFGDLDALSDYGLITELPAADKNARAASTHAASSFERSGPPSRAPLQDTTPTTVEGTVEGTSSLGYSELYSTLTALAREQLGLIKGYRFVLDVERAKDLDALREVARRFVLEVDRAKGDTAGQIARRALGIVPTPH